MTKQNILNIFSLLILIFVSFSNVFGQTSNQEKSEKGKILITVFLKHNQEKTLEEIQKHLDETGFWDEFPPEGAEVVSWYVMMGIGQVVTLKIPVEKLRELNLAVERNAWGAFYTEFYSTYDYVPIWKSKKGQKKKSMKK